MNNFETTLLRERFTITSKKNDSNAKLTAVSNRISCPLYNRKGELVEEFVIRGQNIYSCIRLLSRLVNAFDSGGSLMNRAEPFPWDRIWENSLSDYEKKYNPDIWIAIYHKGKVIFEQGERHPFVDMIEKCAVIPKTAPYETALEIAEQTFQASGKNLSIHHDANVAFIITVENDTVRCALILRGANKTTTFSFLTALSEKDKHITLAPFISAAAAQSEAIQICFIIGLLRYKQETDTLDKEADEHKKLREATARLSVIQAEISNLETSYKVHYRPEKPNMLAMIDETKKAAKKLL